jgi:hypothetical protein
VTFFHRYLVWYSTVIFFHFFRQLFILFTYETCPYPMRWSLSVNSSF